MIEQPYDGRVQIESDGMTLRMIIPAKKNWFSIIFLFLWMGGWFIGETNAIKDLMKSGIFVFDAFLMFWLTGWTFGGLYALFALVWRLSGREIATFDKSVWKIEKEILGLSFISKEYEIGSIKNLELLPEQKEHSIFQQKNINNFFGITGGRILFDYGLKTIKFAIGIDSAEARYIIEEIIKRGFYTVKE